MGHHPFFNSSTGQKATPNHRRSTRVDVAVPVIISGRDASARPFRDEAQTTTVNLHGARIQTHRDLLVGMHLTIECPRTGTIAKAICVRTNESLPDTDLRYVSVQLEKPANIWGVENPPEDWAIRESPDAASPAQRARAMVAAASEVPAPPVAALEQQAERIIDAAAQRLRGMVEEMLGQAFDEFQSRLDAALAEAESRVNRQSDESLAQLESALKNFHEDLSECLDLQSAQTVASTEQALRAQIPAILASILTPGLQTPPTITTDLKSKH